jgi:hypothetical protein
MSQLLIKDRPRLLAPVDRVSLHRPTGKLLVPAWAIKPGTDWKALAALDILPGIGGGDRGVNTEGDLLTTTADGRDLNEIWNLLQTVLGRWNSQRQAIIDFLTFGVTEAVEFVPQVPQVDFEEASEFGEPKRIRGVTYSRFSYDFRWFDVGVSYTWKFLLGASASQIATLANQVLEADNRLVFARVLKAIFNNVNRTVDNNGTTDTVYPFYNNDGTTPPTWKTTSHTSTHDHYLFSTSTTTNVYQNSDIVAIEGHLTHHGYGAVSGSRLVMMMNSANTGIIRGAKAGVNSVSGADPWLYDFIPSASQPAFFGQNVLGGGQPSGNLAGLNVIGTYGNFLVIEDDWLPAGYIFTFATGGEDAADNPVGLRENDRARGLRLVKGAVPDYPLIDSFYNRGFGTGVRKRGAGTVMQVVGVGAAYTIPTAYV